MAAGAGLFGPAKALHTYPIGVLEYLATLIFMNKEGQGTLPLQPVSFAGRVDNRADQFAVVFGLTFRRTVVERV